MYNLVVLVGRLGKDPEIEDVNGNKKCFFTLATSQKWKKEGESYEKTTWHNIVAWRKTAELIKKFFKKGDAILINGRLEKDTWKTDDDGYRERVYVTATSISFVGSGKKQNKVEEDIEEDTLPEQKNESDDEEDDDLPF